MSFLNPLYLWSLLAILPLALVYLMKTKPRKRVTHALFLWKKVLNEKSSHFSLKKLRNLLSLLLMMVMFIVAGVSLANPYWGDEEERSDLIVIIDSSVSMNTRIELGGKTRFELAKDQVSGWLKSVEGGTRFALATVDSGIHYHCSLTSNSHTLKKSLDQLSASEVPLSRQAFSELSVLDSDLAEQSNCRIIFLTDGANKEVKLPDSIDLVTLQLSDVPNFGITASDIAALPGGKAKIFFTVSSSAKTDMELEVELSHIESGNIAKLITLTVPAESKVSEVIEVDAVRDGIWSLTLNEEDVFSEDNRVMMGLNIPEPIAVSIDIEKSYFYTRCVEAFSAAENLLELRQYDENEESSVVLSEGSVKGSNNLSLVFAPLGESVHWENVGDELEGVIVTEAIKDHSLVKHLNLDNITFSGARKLSAPAGALVILKDISGTPLLYVSKSNDQNIVVVNFQPSYDNFYLSPWFPIMVHNGVKFLADRDEELPAVLQNGKPVINSSVTGMSQKYYPIDGSSVISSDVENEFVSGKLGGFTYGNSKKDVYIGAAVLSEGESGSGETGDANLDTASPSSGWPLAWWFLLIAVVIAFAEEALYHRRKVG